LGIDPARNVAAIARQRGINTLCEFFDARVGRRLASQGYAADVVHANNVLAHVADLNGVVEGIRVLLKPEGIAVIEVPYVRDLIEHTEFDTIYHEHLCYFSLTALCGLFQRHHLVIFDVERLPIHGGSLRVFVSKANGQGPRVRALLREERRWGILGDNVYAGFAARVEHLREELCALLEHLKSQDKRIAAYGASAKGSTLLNYFGIGRETLDFCADRSPLKQGRYTPGTHIPVVAPGELLARMPDYVLLLSWNFADEILQQQAAYQQRGGRFIIPVPKVRII
jgi:hypothetical protein